MLNLTNLLVANGGTSAGVAVAGTRCIQVQDPGQSDMRRWIADAVL